MTIAIGDTVPDVELFVIPEDRPTPVSSKDILSKGRVVLFAVPGAFTPGCSKMHLPGFVNKAAELSAKGVDSIVCISVNDAFVMGAWGKAQNAEHLIMLADGSAELAKATGMELDLTDKGMGVRWKRLAMIVDDGVVKNLAIEPPGGIVESSAEAILKLL